MANLVTLIRTLLSLLVVWLLFIPTQPVYIACLALTILVIWMDGIDGFLARKFQESSKLGAMVDILGDRVVEQVYWIAFLALGWIPLWIPLLVVVRGILVDGFRSVALEKGYTAFGSTTMMQSKLGVILVSSRFSRWSYAFLKALAFSALIVSRTPGYSEDTLNVAHSIAWVSIYGTLFFCIVRGLPVILESRRFFQANFSS